MKHSTFPLLRVLHLDHTREPGGAELDLSRVLKAPPSWTAMLGLPPASQGTPNRNELFGLESLSLSPSTLGASSIKSPTKLLRLTREILKNSYKTLRFLQKNPVHLLHTNSTRSALIGALATTFLPRVKLVVHLRDITSKQSLGGFGFVSFTRISLKRADAVIANSLYTLETAQPHLKNRTKTHVIASSIPAQPHLTRTFDGALRFGMVARVTEWKGHDYVLRSFAQAFPQGTNTLHFAGGSTLSDESYMQLLISLATELGIRKRVFFHGHVEEISTFFETIDIGIQYSTTPEPLGQNILQYLASGIPVIASAEGGPLQWVQQGLTGLLVEPRNTSALARALKEMDSNRALCRSMNQKSSAVQVPSPSSVQLMWLEAFQDALNLETSS